LANLLKIGQLKEHAADANEIARLLAAAQRSLADARSGAISAETRFDAAYKAITQLGLAALMAHGYRPDTNRPGHHMTIIQSLTLTLTGEDIDDASVVECIEQAQRLGEDAHAWLRKHRPQLKLK